jgi:hypothetical protein
MFLIRSGTHAGKLVIMTVGQTATTMIDFSALTSGPGPALPSAPTAGLHTFPVTQGPAAGAEMVLAGGTTAYFYDPTAHSFALAPSPAGVNAGAFSFIPVAGVHADRAITVNAQPSTTLNLYPDNLGNFGVYGNLPGPDLPGPGGHALRLSAGGGRLRIFSWCSAMGRKARAFLKKAQVTCSQGRRSRATPVQERVALSLRAGRLPGA